MSYVPWIGLGLLLVLAGLLFFYRRQFLGGKAPTPRNHHLSALEALADGDEARALTELQEAVQQGQGGADAYLRLAQLYRAGGHLKKSIHLHRSLSVGQSWPDEIRTRILQGLAEDYLAAGRWDEALQHLEELRKRDGRNAGIHRRISQVQLRRGDGDKALTALKKAQRLEGEERPDEQAILLSELARRQMSEQRWRDARKSLQEAFKLDADCLPALRLSADLYLNEGKEQEAADEIQKLTLTGQPGSEEDYARMEKLFFELGRYHEIQFVYQEVLSGEPAFWPARFALAGILEKRGRRDEAVKLLDSSLPADVNVAALAASHLLEWEEPERAAVWLERWRGVGTEQRAYRCRHCGTESTRPRWYCPACHGFKSYDPISSARAAAGKS